MHLAPSTANTISRPEVLLDELKEVARLGYAVDNEEFLEGMVAVAVPVRDRAGRYFASLAFHGPVQRLTLDGMINQVPILQNAAKRLTGVFFDAPEAGKPAD